MFISRKENKNYYCDIINIFHDDLAISGKNKPQDKLVDRFGEELIPTFVFTDVPLIDFDFNKTELFNFYNLSLKMCVFSVSFKNIILFYFHKQVYSSHYFSYTFNLSKLSSRYTNRCVTVHKIYSSRGQSSEG